MTTTSTNTGHSLTVQRQISADAEAIFKAWTTAESMMAWMSPGPGMSLPVAKLDVRIGGEYQLVFASPDEEYAHHGTYLEVDPPKRLSFTWISPSTQGQESVVTIDLEPNDGGTLLTLNHTGLPSEDSSASHTGGWANILEGLDKHL